MNEVIIVAVIGCLGSVAGSLLGVIASSNLTQYRLKQLEEKVEKHNSVIERMFEAEGNITELQHEVTDLKKYHLP
jgi:ABC-type lipoprotein release transport system permease subunit